MSSLIGQSVWCGSKMRNRSRCNIKRCCEFTKAAIRFQCQKMVRCARIRQILFLKTDHQMKTKKMTNCPRVIFRVLRRVLQIELFHLITVYPGRLRYGRSATRSPSSNHSTAELLLIISRACLFTAVLLGQEHQLLKISHKDPLEMA